MVESGWDGVLEEAKDAGIPVDPHRPRGRLRGHVLYKTFIGSDFVEEGERAGEWVSENLGTEPIKMVVLEGTTGSAPANDRSRASTTPSKGNRRSR